MKLFKGNDYVIVDEGSEAERLWRVKGFLAEGEKPSKAKAEDEGKDGDTNQTGDDNKSDAKKGDENEGGAEGKPTEKAKGKGGR